MEFKNRNNTKVFNLFNLDEKIAIITGGAGLLGLKHAEALAECGCSLVLVDIDEIKVKKAATTIENEFGTKTYSFVCDITKKKEIEELRQFTLSELNRVDILINNAAIDPKVDSERSGFSFSRLEFFSLEQWQKELEVGLTGAFLCSQVFGFEMAKAGGGVIINISSDLGIIAPNQNLYSKPGLAEEMQNVKPVTYSVIKHGLIGLTKYIATYWADKGVRANTLCPGGVRTNQPQEFIQQISKLIPIGRMANVNEYKAAIAFLASDASSYMNGSTLIIDGGRSIW